MYIAPAAQVNMSEVSTPLLKAQQWAKVAISTLVPDDTLLWSKDRLATSSMFSGACYAERCMEYISSARQGLNPSMPLLSATRPQFPFQHPVVISKLK